jgi:hypothetical protein
MSAVQICDLLGGGSTGQLGQRRPGRRQRSRGQLTEAGQRWHLARAGPLGVHNMQLRIGDSQVAEVRAQVGPAFSRHARFAEPALVNGALGALVAPGGQLILVLTFTVKDDKITEFEVIAEPGRLGRLNLAVPEG